MALRQVCHPVPHFSPVSINVLLSCVFYLEDGQWMVSSHHRTTKLRFEGSMQLGRRALLTRSAMLGSTRTSSSLPALISGSHTNGCRGIVVRVPLSLKVTL